MKQSELSKEQNLKQTVKFALLSISAGIIETAVFTLLERTTEWSYWSKYLPALILSVLWNFTLNRKFTFKSANNIPMAMLKVAGFYLVFTPVSTWAGNALEGKGWNEYLILAVTMVFNLVLEYLFCRFVVYNNSMNTNKSGLKEQGSDARAEDNKAPKKEKWSKRDMRKSLDKSGKKSKNRYATKKKFKPHKK